MSYSLNSKCLECKKETEGCVDGIIVKKAVETIHSMPNKYEGTKRVGPHQGGGSIDHNCVNFVKKEG